jgi:flagellar basal body-associated protein FliL
MSKKVKIILAVISLMVIGGALYYFLVYKKSKDKSLVTDTKVPVSKPADTSVPDLSDAPAPLVKTAEIPDSSLIRTNDAIIIS